MNAFFSLDDFMVYIPECRQQLRHTLNLVCSFITLREPCNNQRPRCDIELLHVANKVYHGFINRRYAFDDATHISNKIYNVNT